MDEFCTAVAECTPAAQGAYRYEVLRAQAEGRRPERVLMPAFLRLLRKRLLQAGRQPLPSGAAGGSRETAAASSAAAAEQLDILLRLSDLRSPGEWYPEARQLRRRVIMHAGPTNSGKTHHALRRLRDCGSGVYAGPLRLLAHEVYERLNGDGVACNLLTGEERRETEGVPRWAATVEMTPLGRRLEVAVIDEVQMLSDPQRGWAWTQALLGVQADEVHVCGEEAAVDLVRRLCESSGDEFEVRRYQRLTPLEVEETGMSGLLRRLRYGDCVIAFSRRAIFDLRRRIEEKTGAQCAVVYGNLPPEVRAEQARLFNDPNGKHAVMIASDAVGMGLNLNIRRVVFTSLAKFNGTETVPLSDSQIRQIGGRAGRFRTANEVGFVTTMHNADIKRVRKVMEDGAAENARKLKSAGLFPTLEQVER
ncbi:RNA helicase, partial [Cladochytrium tenue]